jgi:hypothetical protein
MRSYRFQRAVGWCETARCSQEITPEQAAERKQVSVPGFSPLTESALLDAQRDAASAAN